MPVHVCVCMCMRKSCAESQQKYQQVAALYNHRVNLSNETTTTRIVAATPTATAAATTNYENMCVRSFFV